MNSVPEIQIQTSVSHHPFPLHSNLVSDSAERLRSLALIQRRYAQRGYVTKGMDPSHDELTTFSLGLSDTMSGTLSVRFDGPNGLGADEVFGAELDELRQDGRKLCEFTRLAMEEMEQPSKDALARLFQTAYVFAHRRRHAELLVIEVNPRHVVFYRRMLGFKVMGETRFNERVRAPAVLMVLDLEHARQEIDRVGGSAARGEPARSLYAYMLPTEQGLQLV
ncbi:N-acetyltransferase [Pelomonas sp. SE-A7]|uniref:N-acyl amino acid synthase FeeM domain-containing protein n=1 Tax=Pelomonas sp. SE-A7 TaxID=3054953 RepID=UPI00259CE112|nr:N-acetyltransferase [Pelomonas sp. SE-A7]MDM4767334.1 N-acetyltransferase [Pelomonas sp. SE-A7]